MSDDPPSESGFATLGLDARLLAALSALGYEEPTPVQRQAIPPMVAGRDVLAQAATGTGKTAAFALPMLHRLAAQNPGGVGGGAPPPGAAADPRKLPFGLVMVPTRELAMQVAEAVHRYGRELSARVLAVYGGSSMGQQLRALERGVDVVVATPGRALDHVKRGSLVLSEVGLVVLDEADEMLDMGFAEDIEALLDAVPGGRPMALFSATLPTKIEGLAGRRLKDPVSIRISGERSAAGAATAPVRQVAYVVSRAHKPAALSRVLDVEAPSSAIVFCRTRTEVDELTETLNARGYRAEALHGGFSQEQRDRVMKRFRTGALDLLIATDVAARGLDVEQVSHVVNYDVPSETDAYVHRIGRTGRAGREGMAITLFEPRERWLLRNAERATGQRIEMATLPTVADLHARRLELTRASLREAIVGGELDRFRVVVESLAQEFDLLDVAAAGIKLAHIETGPREEAVEIPHVSLPPERPAIPARRAERPYGPPAGFRPGGPERSAPGTAEGQPQRGFVRSPERASPRPGSERRAPGLANAVSVFVGAGRQAGIRPADLFGAITGEAGVSPRAIGSIEIADRFSLVEVSGDVADEIIEALRSTTIRGLKVNVRRERDEPSRAPEGGYGPPREKPFAPRERPYPPRERSFAPQERTFPHRDRPFKPRDRAFAPADRAPQTSEPQAPPPPQPRDDRPPAHRRFPGQGDRPGPPSFATRPRPEGGERFTPRRPPGGRPPAGGPRFPHRPDRKGPRGD